MSQHRVLLGVKMENKIPCAFSNPALWRKFCVAAKRDEAPSYNWTEEDVIFWFEEMKTSNQELDDFQTISHVDAASFAPPETPKEGRVSRHNDELRAAFSARLFALDISNREAADLLGVTERSISRWINGHVPVPRMAIMALELVEMKR